MFTPREDKTGVSVQGTQSDNESRIKSIFEIITIRFFLIGLILEMYFS